MVAGLGVAEPDPEDGPPPDEYPADDGDIPESDM